MRLRSPISVLTIFIASIPIIDLAAQNYIFELYPPINGYDEFVQDCLAFAEDKLGAPKIKIHKVFLRRSTPRDSNAGLRHDFSSTGIVDGSKGLFAIYLSRTPSEIAFEGQLAHEVCHLLNARLFDAYVEGLNSVIAERYLMAHGYPWGPWLEYFEADRQSLYSASYFMMKEIWNLVGDEKMHNFLSYAIVSDSRKNKWKIDIDAWLKTLNSQQKNAATKIIKRYAEALQKGVEQKGKGYSFMLPK